MSFFYKLSMQKNELSSFSNLENTNYSNSWQNALKGPLDISWFNKELDTINQNLFRTSHLRIGSRSEDIRTKPALEKDSDSIQQSLKIMAGGFDENLIAFLSNCRFNEIPIPSLNRTINTPKEPSGEDVVNFNFSPEWLRHFLRLYYDKGSFEKRTGCSYFPYENRDHLVHTLMVLVIGNFLLGSSIRLSEVKLLETRLLNDFPRKESYIKRRLKNDTAIDLFDLISIVYELKFNLRRDTSKKWIKIAWKAISLWHDSGYDASTWFLLSSKEFSHTEIASFVSLKKDIISPVIDSLLDSLDPLSMSSNIIDSLNDAKNNIANPNISPYHFIHGLDCCFTGKPSTNVESTWGRFHALFSAFEFIQKFDKSSCKIPLSHLASAIAEHHEPSINSDLIDSSNTIIDQFVINPIGMLLKFADALAASNRARIENSHGPVLDISGNKGTLSLFMDLSAKPLWIQKDPSGIKKNEFFVGNPYLFRQKKKEALWGVILEEKQPKVSKKSCFSRSDAEYVSCPFKQVWFSD